MKKLIALVASSVIILSPAIALAEDGQGGSGGSGPGPAIHTEAEVEMHGGMPGDNRGPGFPRLGAAIHDLASTTRAGWKGLASTTREAVRMKVHEIHDLIEQHKEAMQERADDAKAKAKARFGEHVEGLVGNVSDRLASTSKRLADIADRIGTRIDTLQGQGFEMASSSSLLTIAQGDIAAANDKIAAVNTALADAMATTTPKAQIPAVRTAVKAAEDALNLAKTDLMRTIEAVKVESAATSTASI